MNEHVEHPVEGIMGKTMEELRAMSGADTIIGEQIVLPDGVVIIPVSKVSYGFASAGSDFPSKQQQKLFGGGGGAGMTIQPIAFLTAKAGKVNLINISSNPDSTDKVIKMIPEMFDRIVELLQKNKKDQSEKTDLPKE